MTIGEELFIACLRKKNHKVLSAIQKKWLDGQELRQYSTVMGYYREHGEMMGVKAFCEKFSLDEAHSDSRPAYYLNQLKERYIFASMSDNIPRILKGVKEDPRGKLSEMQTLIASLAVDAVESRDVLYSDDTESREAAYLERTESKGVTYLSMGSEDLDKVLFGYRRQDLITIGGKAGQGKTWSLVYLAYLLDKVLKGMPKESHYGDILFVSNEMGADEISERIDCINFRLPYEKFLSGTLTEREKSRYFRGLESMRKNPSRIRLLDGCQTIEELSTYMGLYQPSVVFIDGSYLMEGKMQEGWEKIVYITRNLKRLAKSFMIPIVNTTQLRRGSSKSGSKFALDGQDDFAYSSSYAQDSDIAIRMYQDADMKYHDVVGCEVVKGRRVKSGTTLIFQNDLDKMCQSITLSVEDDSSDAKTEEYVEA